MSARADILSRLRGVLKRAEGDGAEGRVTARLAARRAGVVPAVAETRGAERAAQFCAKAERNGITLAEVADYGGVVAAVRAYLRAHNLPGDSLVVAPHPLLDELSWSEWPGLVRHHGAARLADAVGLSVADLGVAESGCLLFASGRASPTTLHFVPETEIVVLSRTAIVGGLEDAWAYLRAKGQSQLPRAVNLVTGPSRTADIELTLTLGAHGPRRLHVILVGLNGAAENAVGDERV